MTNSELFSQTNENEQTANPKDYSNWSIEDLVNKAEAADAHINKLELENKDFRTNDETLREVLKRLDQVNQPSQNIDPSMNVNPHPEQSNSGGVDQTEIEKMVSLSFDRKQKESTAKANVLKVETELKRVWGDNYSKHLHERTKELGVKQEYLESMAENYPDLFIKTVLGETSKSNPNVHVPPTSTTSPTQTDVGNLVKYREFAKLEKDNPQLRLDTAFQQRKLQAAAKYGDSFYQ